MPYSHDDYLKAVGDELNDGAEVLSLEKRKRALANAVRWYSRWFPRIAVKDLTSDGTGDFATSGLIDFSPTRDSIASVEYPISTAGQSQTYLDKDSYPLYQSLDGSGNEVWVIRIQNSIASDEKIRIRYNAPHVLTAQEGAVVARNTIPDSDFMIVVKWALKDCADMLARHYAQTSENTFLTADISVARSKSQEYRSLAREAKDYAESFINRFMAA